MVQTAEVTQDDRKLDIIVSRQFTAWMAEQRVSLALSTYQTGKLFLFGLQPTGKLSVFERNFWRVLGLCAYQNSLYVGMHYQIWRMENVLPEGEHLHHYDRIYVPRVAHMTGDIDAHDMSIDRHGNLLFVNTLFSCLATLSDTHSFTPIWQPPFITKLAAEDRCHLNGLAMKDGLPKYATAVCQSNTPDGWRDGRMHGGMVMDIDSNEIVLDGLSMPHSPRWYRDKLWLHNSGTGYFGYMENGAFVPMTFCPGYLRGLDFVGDYAVCGLSLPRYSKSMPKLEVLATLSSKDSVPRCGIQVIDLRTGEGVHWLRMEGTVQEIYDVVLLPNVVRPMALGFKTDEIRRVITIGS